MAKRYQVGHVYRKHGAFHVRYRTTIDGRRVQLSARLCDIDREHQTARSKSVLKKRDDFMRAINDETRAEKAPSVTVADFYDRTYLPWAESQLKPSSLHSLKQIWAQHLKEHFGGAALDAYKTPAASKFLTALAAKYSRNTVQHVRSTMSGVFTHAINLGEIESNPIHECRVLVKMRAPSKTAHYTLEELEDVVSALVDEPELQLIVCLAGFAGLRPGEIIALKWSDFDQDCVHVRRAEGRGVISTPKTDSSIGSVPLIAPTKLALAAWRARCGSPTDGWVFPGRFKDRPGVMSVRTRAIATTLKAKNVPWKTLYAGRRAAATILTQLTGNPLAAAQLLRHKDYAITMAAYIKQDRRALTDGMKLLEAKLLDETTNQS